MPGAEKRTAHQSLAQIALGWSIVAVIALLPRVGSTVEAEVEIPELQAKSAYLFNIGRFIQWPSSAFETRASPIILGVRGDHEFQAVAEIAFAGRTLHGRAVLVKNADGLADLSDFHLLFVGRENLGEEESLIGTLRDTHTFAVADYKGYAERGGAASFLKVESRIRLEVNRKAVSQQGLKLSSQLLRLSILVGE